MPLEGIVIGSNDPGEARDIMRLAEDAGDTAEIVKDTTGELSRPARTKKITLN